MFAKIHILAANGKIAPHRSYEECIVPRSEFRGSGIAELLSKPSRPLPASDGSHRPTPRRTKAKKQRNAKSV